MTNTAHDPSTGELPAGWERHLVEEVCRKVEKVNPAELGRSTFRYVDIGSIDNQGGTIAEAKELPVGDAPTRARQRLRHGDTVFSTVRPYLRNIAWVSEELDDEIASTGFCVLGPERSSISAKFLFYFSSSDQLLDQVLPLQRGVSYPAVRDRDILSAKVAIPPLAEQEQIVEILEAHLSRLDAVLEHIQTLRGKAAQFRRSLLHAAFTGVLTGHDPSTGELPAGWIRETLSASCEMYQPKTISKKELVEGGAYPVYGANGRIGSYTEFNHEDDEVTVTCRGACGTVNVIPGRSWITGNAMVVRPLGTNLRKAFLAFLLRSVDYRPVITGTVQPQITRKTLSTVEILRPPLAEQEQIVEILEAHLSRLDATLAVVDAVEERAHALRRSLLHTAFTGKLTEKWREQAHV